MARSSKKLDDFEDIVNPLDNVEDVLRSHNWDYNRASEDELIVTVAGKACSYRLFFIWQEDLNLLQFCCQYDLTVMEENVEAARNIMMDINETLILGHFDLPRDTATPSLRHTSLLRGMSNDNGFEKLEDLIDISLTLCERHYSAFSLLTAHTMADKKVLNLALMETVGES